MSMKKNFNNAVSDCSVTDEDLKLINEISLKELKREDIFCFNIKLCDNEIDRDTERFDLEALEKLAVLFVGKTGIFDHSMKGKDQVARIFEAHVEKDASRKTTLSEEYCFLKAKAYMPRTAENQSLISEIEAGIKKEVSINCSVKEKICSVCGKNLNEGFCEHKKGGIYNSKICHRILSSPTDAYEWSFVAVPAQRDAGTIKSFTEREQKNMKEIIKGLCECSDSITLSKENATELANHINALEKAAEEGKEYKSFLKQEIIKLSVSASPELSSKSVENICGNLDVSALKGLLDDMAKASAKKNGIKPQLASDISVSENTSNKDYLI